MITFIEPERLWLLLLVAAVLLVHVVGRRRPAAYPITLSTTRFAAEARRRRGPAWRRHLPAAGSLGLLALLVLGFARPATTTRAPAEAVDVMVALDTSGSMNATDVAPDRLAAAREAAADFVGELPAEARVGVVVFAGGAVTALQPTTDRVRALDAVAGAQGPGERGTAIGDAVAASMAALAAGGVAPGAAGTRGGEQADTGRRIVVLSDGDNTAGRPLEDAVRDAAAAGVPVDTIAFGTAAGSIVLNGRTVPVPVAEASLAALAEGTGGALRTADDTDDLARAYADIAGSLAEREQQREWTGVVGLIAALGAALVAFAGIRRTPSLPGRTRPARPTAPATQR